MAMKERDDKNKRFESYPKPSEADNQLKNQPEFIDEFPNETEDDTEAPSTKVNLPKRSESSEGDE